MELKQCESCGARLSEGEPQSLCAKCLLRIGLPTEPRALHFRCPHCRQPIEILDETSLGSIICPSCDSQFNLVDGEATLPSSRDQTQRIDQFELMECVGSGAFGSVWKAHDTQLDRIVAVKLPRQQNLSSAEVESFFREARAAAQLHHGAIVSVYEVGRAEERVYIVSEFIDGITLADYLASERLSSREAARWCVTIADALQHAHNCGVIHRDLKPSNILLRRSTIDPNSPSEMSLFLTDFGLARRESGEMTITVEGRILGTPAYMSPEQARGEGHHVDGRSDVYSLGVILFEMLTGEKPFRGNSRMLIDQVLQQEPPSPRQLNNLVPRDLTTICLKCLQKSPSRRYATANDLADDLRRFLDDHAILARPVSRVEKTVRWCYRNPIVAALSFAVAMSLVIGLTATFWQWRQSEGHRQQAHQRSQEAVSQLVRMQINKGNQALNADDPLEALVWYGEALDQCDRGKTESKDQHVKSAFASQASEASLRRRIGIINRQLPVLLHGFSHEPAEIRTADYSPDGSRIVTVSDEGFRLWDSERGDAITPLVPLQSEMTRAAFSPSGKWLIVLSSRPGNMTMYQTLGQVRILDANSGQAHLPPIELDNLSVFHVAFPPGEDFLAVAAGESVHVLDTATGEHRVPPIKHRQVVCQVEISPDGSRLASCGHEIESSASAKLFDLQNSRLILNLDGQLVNSDAGEERFYPQNVEINAFPPVFSPDGQYFTTFDFDVSGGRAFGPQSARLRSAESGELVHDTMRSRNWIESVMFTADSQTVYVNSGGTPLVYRTSDGQSLTTDLRDGYGHVQLLPDRRSVLSVAAVGSDTEVKINEESGSWSVKFPGRFDSLTPRNDATGFALGTRGAERSRGELHIYDAATEQKLSFAAWHNHLRGVFHPDLNRMLEVRHGIARQWDLTLHRSRRIQSDINNQDVLALELSPSGRFLVIGQGRPRSSSGEWDSLQAIELPTDSALANIPASNPWPWDDIADSRVGPLTQFNRRVWQVCFAPDDETIVAALLDDHRLGIWDVHSGQRIAPLISNVSRVRFSPDGSQFISNYQINSVRLWDTESGDPLSLAINTSDLRDGPDSRVPPVLSADQKTLICTSTAGLRLWDVRPDERPTEAIRRDAWAMSGFMVDDVGGYVPVSTKEFVMRLEPIDSGNSSDVIRITEPDSQSLYRAAACWHEDQAFTLFGVPWRVFRDWNDWQTSDLRSLPSRFHYLRFESDHTDVLSKRGIVHRLSGDHESAVRDLDRAIAGGAMQPELFMHRGLAKYVLGNREGAGDDIATALKLGAKGELEVLTPPDLAAAAATGITRRMASQSPLDETTQWELIEQRGRFYLNARQWSEAIADFSMLIESGRPLHGERANAWMALEDLQAAIDDLSAALEHINYYRVERLDRAGAAVMLGDFSAGYDDFEIARQQGGNAADEIDACWLLVLQLDPNADPGDVSRLQESLRAAVRKFLGAKYPYRYAHERAGLNTVLVSLALVEQEPEALADVQRLAKRTALELPSRPEAWFAYALALQRSGENELAIEILKRIDDAQPCWRINSLLLHASAQQQLGNKNAVSEALTFVAHASEAFSQHDRWQTLAIQKVLQQA